MLTDKTSNKALTRKVLIPRNPRQITFTHPVNNIVIKTPISTNQPVNSNSQKLFLLKVTDNKKQPHYIRIPPVNVNKFINNQVNFDVKLEQVKAPIHILDHSYAANQNVNGNNFPNSERHIQQNLDIVKVQHNTTQPTKVANIEQCNVQNGNKVIRKINFDTKKKPIVIKPVNEEVISRPAAQLDPNSDKAVIAELRKQLKAKTAESQLLQKNLKRLQKESKVVVKKRLQETLKNVFSVTQIDKLLNPHKAKIKWTVEDIISALTLQNISLKAYSYLRENNYPLPGLSTIRKWTAQINLTEGLLKEVLVIMKFRTKSLSLFQKIVILYFDELCISNENCLICIASGLFYKWMQPVYLSREKKFSFNIIKEIVSQLYNVGFIVVALTCNLRDENIWKQLNIGVNSGQKCYFLHPSNVKFKIFVFPDERHLLTLIRQQFLDHGFVIKEKHVKKQCLEELTTVSKKLDAKFCKVIDDILDDSKSDQSQVVLAKQLFSKMIAEKIFTYGQEGYIPYDDWEEAANFFETMNKWIKLFSVKSGEGYSADEEPYGLALDTQNDTLNKMKTLMKSTKIDTPETLTAFQEQVILRCNSLEELLAFLKSSFSAKNFSLKYILTNKLSSDCLQNVTAYLTSSDGANSKPQELSEITQSKFQSKFRKCILGKYLSDYMSSHVWKILDPCLIDFNEKSDPTTTLINNSAANQKEVASNAMEEEYF